MAVLPQIDYTGVPLAERVQEARIRRARIVQLNSDGVSRKEIAEIVERHELTVRDVLAMENGLTRELVRVLCVSAQYSKRREAAVALGISLCTLKKQLNRIFQYYDIDGVRDKLPQAYELAKEEGLISEPKAEPEPGKEFDFYLERALSKGYTRVQFVVLWELSWGKLHKAIGEEEDVTTSAIGERRERLYDHLRVKNRYQAVRRAVREKILPPIGKTEGYTFPQISREERTLLSRLGYGLTYEQIGRKLGLRAGQVEHRLSVIRARLREHEGYIEPRVHDFCMYIKAVRSGRLRAIKGRLRCL